jgi:hypothetical protein
MTATAMIIPATTIAAILATIGTTGDEPAAAVGAAALLFELEFGRTMLSTTTRIVGALGAAPAATGAEEVPIAARTWSLAIVIMFC